MLTSNIPKLMEQVEEGNIHSLFHLLNNDPALRKSQYGQDDWGVTIFNAASELYTPKEPHQMIAKGSIFFHSAYGDVDLVSMPYSKIYNSFEGVAVEDAKYVRESRPDLKPVIQKKMDGTLISRFVFGNKVHFATRSRIISMEDPEYWEGKGINTGFSTPTQFYDLVKKVIEKKGYKNLLDPSFMDRSTLIFELVGPSNVILELHEEDDLILTGKFNLETREMYLAGVLDEHWGLNVAPTYSGTNPESVLKSLTGVQEGIILNYVDSLERVHFKVKYKTEAYLNLLRAKSDVSEFNLLKVCVEQRFTNFREFEEHFKTSEHSAYLEELVELYRNLWDTSVSLNLVNFYRVEHRINYAYQIIIQEGLQEPKERYFRAKDLVGQDIYAGWVASMLRGKYGPDKITELLLAAFDKNGKLPTIE